MKKSDIIDAIDNQVRSIESKKYSIWTIGVTDDPDTRKDKHKQDGENVNHWQRWNADSENDARDIEAHFIKNGMKGGTGGGGKANYVYIF